MLLLVTAVMGLLTLPAVVSRRMGVGKSRIVRIAVPMHGRLAQAVMIANSNVCTKVTMWPHKGKAELTFDPITTLPRTSRVWQSLGKPWRQPAIVNQVSQNIAIV